MTRRTVVAVAMSGGVDSSVAAALAVAAGHEVFGLMLRLWSESGAAHANACCSREAVDDAAAVAARLDIPFTVLDMADEFRRAVVDPFVAESAAGDTPNPCVVCNRRVRFGLLLARARALGADQLATGHYARIARDTDGRCRLLRAVDPAKDQSYVLHALDQAQLAHTMFPVGAMAKADVRAHAARLGLTVADRAESVDLCWLGADGVAGFLARQLPSVAPLAARPGPIVDRDGHVLGTHRGLPYYTHGQRRGVGVAVGEPRYVIDRDIATNSLVVGPLEALFADVVQVRDMHWIAGTAPTEPLRVSAQVRYRAAAAPAWLVPLAGGAAEARFDEPQRAPTPGQALVAYDGEVCLGGGRIAARAGG